MRLRLILSFGAIYISLSLVYFLFERWEMNQDAALFVKDPLALASLFGLVAVIWAFAAVKRRWTREDGGGGSED